MDDIKKLERYIEYLEFNVEKDMEDAVTTAKEMAYQQYRDSHEHLIYSEKQASFAEGVDEGNWEVRQRVEAYGARFFEVFDTDLPLDPKNIAKFICSQFDRIALEDFVNEVTIISKLGNIGNE